VTCFASFCIAAITAVFEHNLNYRHVSATAFSSNVTESRELWSSVVRSRCECGPLNLPWNSALHCICVYENDQIRA
jgi:hypothetical protein